MDNNREPERQAPLTKKGMSDFRKAFMWTAIPIIVFSIINAGMTFFNHWVGFGIISGFALWLWLLAILACIGFAIARKRQIALGTLVGIGIGIVGLGLTCFAAMFNV